MINFRRDAFIIQDLNTERMIGKGRKIEGLYVLEDVSSSHGISINQIAVSTWHNRLGHPSAKVLHSLNIHLSFDNSIPENKAPCYICPLAKQRRLPFISHHNVATFAIELIHCDVWDSYHVPTHKKDTF